MTLQISKIPRPFERSDQVQQAARETVLNTNRLTENKKDKTPTGVLVRSLRHSASLRSRVSPRLCCYVCLSASFAFLQGNFFLFPFVKAKSIRPKFPLFSPPRKSRVRHPRRPPPRQSQSRRFASRVFCTFFSSCSSRHGICKCSGMCVFFFVCAFTYVSVCAFVYVCRRMFIFILILISFSYGKRVKRDANFSSLPFSPRWRLVHNTVCLKTGSLSWEI